MTDTGQADKRRYRGMDAHERLAVRRASLIEAGLELFGTAGYAATTVEDVCRHAGLAKRYFYESFSDREGLLVALYHQEIAAAQQVLVDAVLRVGPAVEKQVEAGLTAFIRHFGADRRKARIVFVEIIRAGEGVEHHYHQARRLFADFIIGALTQSLGIPRTTRIELGATVLVGAIVEVMWEWTLGYQKSSIDEILDGAILLFNLLYRQYVQELADRA